MNPGERTELLQALRQARGSRRSVYKALILSDATAEMRDLHRALVEAVRAIEDKLGYKPRKRRIH